jgi:uncharacterized protein DUF4365
MDHLLSGQDREEALSRAYVQAVAAGAGYVTATMDFDRDGVDLEIKAGGAMRPSIGLQLKSTVNLPDHGNGIFRFALKRRNYDLLRIETQMPRILVVLRLPKDEEKWLSISEDALILRHCAFWVSLANAVDVDNETSVTITNPSANRFTVDNLQNLMEQSRKGVIL